MEKKMMILNLAKWLAVPLSGIMYIGTYRAFGDEIAMGLGVLAGMAFFILLRKEYTRIIGETITREIKGAIYKISRVESIIEIKRMNRGIIARVYLINAKEKAAEINNAIHRALENSEFSRQLWIMQLTDMDSKDDLKKTQSILNDQLLEELSKMSKKNK